MEKHLKIQDTCGIHNLHAMPGLIGGIVGAITAAAATESVYGKEGWVFLREHFGGGKAHILSVFLYWSINTELSLHFLIKGWLILLTLRGHSKTWCPPSRAATRLQASVWPSASGSVEASLSVRNIPKQHWKYSQLWWTAACVDNIVPLRLYFKITHLGWSSWWQLL